MNTNKKLLNVCKMLLNLIGDGFHREGGTDLTSWDVCGECGNADWKGHKNDCAMKYGIDKAKSAVEAAEALEKAQ